MRESETKSKLLRTRATAVSVLAEAWISVEQAEAVAQWQPEAFDESQLLMAEAERQLKRGHAAAAIYFASRGQHVALSVIDQSKHAKSSVDTRFVSVDQLNVRRGPSAREPVIVRLERGTPVFEEGCFGRWVRVLTLRGERGWIHDSLASTDIALMASDTTITEASIVATKREVRLRKELLPTREPSSELFGGFASLLDRPDSRVRTPTAEKSAVLAAALREGPTA